jgi:hypothetical protein
MKISRSAMGILCKRSVRSSEKDMYNGLIMIQTIMCKMRVRSDNLAKRRILASILNRIVKKMNDAVNEKKHDNAKSTWITINASVKIPIHAVDIPALKRLSAPSAPNLLFHSTWIRASANIPNKIPVTIKPPLKRKATGAIPKSLSALCVQVNQGETIIDTPIIVMAKIGAMIPNHTAIFGS